MFPHPDPVEQAAIEATINGVVALDRKKMFRAPPLFLSDAHEAACILMNEIRKAIAPVVNISGRLFQFYHVQEWTPGLYVAGKTYGQMSCRELLIEYWEGRECTADNIMRYPPVVFVLSYQDSQRLGRVGYETRETKRLRRRMEWCAGLSRDYVTSTGVPLGSLDVMGLKMEFLKVTQNNL